MSAQEDVFTRLEADARRLPAYQMDHPEADHSALLISIDQRLVLLQEMLLEYRPLLEMVKARTEGRAASWRGRFGGS